MVRGLIPGWYVVLDSEEVTNKPLGVQRLGQKLVFWRDTTDKMACSFHPRHREPIGCDAPRLYAQKDHRAGLRNDRRWPCDSLDRADLVALLTIQSKGRRPDDSSPSFRGFYPTRPALSRISIPQSLAADHPPEVSADGGVCSGG